MSPPASTPPVAFLFPGQGSQQVGMGVELNQASASAAQTFAEAESVLGWSVLSLCAEGPMERLTATEHLQPALLTVSVAAWRALREQLPSAWAPAAALGHSLGEYAALVCAGALDFGDALRLVELRGRLMAAAVPDGLGAMAAVIGLEPEAVRAVCEDLASESGGALRVANINAPGQVVISGHAELVAKARASMKAASARGVIPLKVSAPFHCSMMASAAQGLAQALEDVEIRETVIPVLSNVSGHPHGDPASIRRALANQVVEPVRWVDCVRWVLAQGVSDFVELGPGRVLAGLLRRTERSARCLEVADGRGLEAWRLFVAEEAS